MKLYATIPLVLQILAWAPSVLIFKVLCNYKVEGTENLKGLTQAVFACNHSGELDPILLTAAVLPAGFTPMFFVGAPDREFDHKFFGWRRIFYKGWFFRAWGMYPLVRGAHDYAVSLAAHKEILTHGYSLCIFPEGGVSTTGEIREGKGGVGYLHYATRVPVVPVHIAGTARQVTPGIFSGRKKLKVTVCAPITYTDPASRIDVSDYKAFATKVMDTIRNSAL